MIAFKVDLADLSRPWSYTPCGWVNQGSWIRPFRHRQLREMAFSDGIRFCVAVSEIYDGNPWPHGNALGMNISPARYDAALSLACSCPANMILIEINPGLVQLRAGAMGAAPVYLAARKAELHGSWDITALKDHMSASRLNESQVARMLAQQGNYGHATIFNGIFQLTECSRACFDQTGIHLYYPPPAQHFLPRQIAPGADVVAGFGQLLDAVTASRPVDAARTAVHLSGGQDSANVAVTLAERYPGELTSCAIVLPEPTGRQQMRRRRALIRHGGFDDITVQAMDHLPLEPAGPRQAASLVVSPMDEPYSEANQALLEALAARGIDALYTGFGGDEVMSTRGEEKTAPASHPELPPWLGPHMRDLVLSADEHAPPSAVPETTLMALAAISPVLLRAGFWPIAPFSDHALIRFGEWLPLEWRKNKRLLREHLIRLGLPKEVSYPLLAENFSMVMAAALNRYGAPMLAQGAADGILTQLGFVDRDELLAASERAASGLDSVDHRLYAVAALESALRQIEGTPTDHAGGSHGHEPAGLGGVAVQQEATAGHVPAGPRFGHPRGRGGGAAGD